MLGHMHPRQEHSLAMMGLEPRILIAEAKAAALQIGRALCQTLLAAMSHQLLWGPTSHNETKLLHLLRHQGNHVHR